MGRIKIFMAALALFSVNAVYAQRTVNIWPGLAPGAGNEKNKERIVNERIYDVYQPDLTVYLPGKPDANRPAVVVCPGGGYDHLAIELEGTSVARWLNDNHIAAFVLKYRLNPDQALDDAKRAMSLVRADAKKYGINRDMVGILGFSAGGQVAAGLATHYERTTMKDHIDSVSCRPDFMVLVYPALDWLHPNADEEYARLGPKASFIPYFHLVDKDTPPTFIVHAADDETVPVNESVQFFTALHDAGVPCELHIFEKGGHGFGLGEDRGAVDSWPALCVEWMKTRGILSMEEMKGR